MACCAREPADRPRDGEPTVDVALWQGHCAQPVEFWVASRTADASRAARLAGRRNGPPPVVAEGDAPPDHALGDLPGEQRCDCRRRTARSRESAVATPEPATARSRADSRRNSVRGWGTRSDNGPDRDEYGSPAPSNLSADQPQRTL